MNKPEMILEALEVALPMVHDHAKTHHVGHLVLIDFGPWPRTAAEDTFYCLETIIPDLKSEILNVNETPVLALW